MEISTLNKVINLFLVGLFTLSMIFVFKFQAITSWLKSQEVGAIVNSISVPLAIFVATLVLLSTSLFLGLLADSIISLLRSVEFFKRKFSKDSWVVRRLQCEKQIKATKDLESKLQSAYQASQKYTVGDPEVFDRTFTVALFFHTAKPENFEWLIQHYSMYLLAANYSLLLSVALILGTLSLHSWTSRIVFWMIDGFAIYLLLRTAINRYFYAYEVVNRQVLVVLSEAKPITNEESLTLVKENN